MGFEMKNGKLLIRRNKTSYFYWWPHYNPRIAASVYWGHWVIEWINR